MVKKARNLMLPGILLLVIVLTGCATAVSVRYMIPAEIDLSSHKNLAVLSVEPYRFGAFSSPSGVINDMSGTSPYRISSGFAPNTEREVAKYLTSRIVSDLSRTDYFKLLSPPSSDSVGTNFTRFKELGYEAVLLVRVASMDVQEYIFAKEETVKVPPAGGVGDPVEQKVLMHHVMQKIAYTVEFTVRDTSSGNIITSKSFSDSRESSYKIIPDSLQSKVAPDLSRWFQSMSERFSREFVQLLVPRWVTQYVSLMDNKPEVRSLKSAYEQAKAGSMGPALEAFLAEWKRSKHVPSGYNAAIIMDSLGRDSDALKLLEEVWQYSGNRTVERRLYEMREAMRKHEEAQKQM